VFDDLQGATKAVREMQNFNFYGKPMRVQYSKNRSDIITKADGTFVPREKTPLAPLPSKQKNQASVAVSSAQPISVPVSTAQPMVEEAQPNKLLFIQNLPNACTESMLEMLFKQYEGFKEARTVTGRTGIAFVEFEDSYKASKAKDSLDGFQMTDENNMQITFAK
jgi:RNA recognition motif-containing protein